MGELSARDSAMTEGVRPAEFSDSASGDLSFTISVHTPSVAPDQIRGDTSPIEGEVGQLPLERSNPIATRR
jgi:hypothetical protein